MQTTPEIAALRFQEKEMQRFGAEADKLCRDLICRFSCDFVIADNMPLGSWAKLPPYWQAGVESPVEPKWGKPPSSLKGPVAVSLATLRNYAAC